MYISVHTNKHYKLTPFLFSNPNLVLLLMHDCRIEGLEHDFITISYFYICKYTCEDELNFVLTNLLYV